MNFFYKKVLVIGDRQELLEEAYNILSDKRFHNLVDFNYASSPQTRMHSEVLPELETLDLSKRTDDLIKRFDLIISLHCRQIFTPELVSSVKCINVHPGLNPYNRGWYPHIFSIINKLPVGVTIHEMDEKVDHGPIIFQEEIAVASYDTSETLYERLQALEKKLFRENIEIILRNDYESTFIDIQDRPNTKKDFDELKKIDISKSFKGIELVDRLRALTHGDYKNAYFIDEDGRKVFIKIRLEVEDDAI